MNKTLIAALLVIFLVACAPITPPKMTNTTNGTMESETPPLPQETEQPTATDTNTSDLPRKEVTEGDLVNFPNLKAVDPDGDPITYTFSSPLDAKGQWQTAIGNAGQYKTTITASDGTNTVSQEVLIIVKSRNKPSVIELSDPVKTVAGMLLTLEPKVTDPEGDNVTIAFSGWMNSASKNITKDDIGNHKVTITADDGTSKVSKDIIVIVEKSNKAPVISELSSITVREGAVVSVTPTAKDEDGDNLTYTFEFPLNEDGKWQTKVGDAGEYTLAVRANDGKATAETTVMITVETANKAPTLSLENVALNEGETVTLSPTVNDPEGDEVKLTYTGWMSTNTKTTTYTDAGTHNVKITASDTAGNEASVDVIITVYDINRPPTFGQGAFN